jgi:RNA-directed DNA polymerase
VERRGRLTRNVGSFNRDRWSWEEAKMYMPQPKDKPFAIPKSMVWEAYRRVAANKGAPGVDGQALEQFEADLRDNLYVIWNRMSSGSYFPPPVRAVEIPKPHGDGVRVLGVPTVTAYRVLAQRVFGFVGRHASVPSASRRAAGDPVCASPRRRAGLRL